MSTLTLPAVRTGRSVPAAGTEIPMETIDLRLLDAVTETEAHTGTALAGPATASVPVRGGAPGTAGGPASGGTALVRVPQALSCDDPDLGASTAEYAVIVLAAAAFGGVMAAVLSSDSVSGLLLGIIQKALSF